MSKNNKMRFICNNCLIIKNPKTSSESANKLEVKIEELIISVSFMSKEFDEFNDKIESMFKELKLVKIENEQTIYRNT